MSTIVQELQKASINSSVATSELLRIALVCSKKLKAKEFEEWIQNEQNGYMKGQDIPGYRNVPGRLFATDPFLGFVPIVFDDPDTQEKVSKKYISESVNHIEELVKGKKEIAVPVPQFRKLISTADGYTPESQVYFIASKPYLKSLLQTIRDVILNWSLKLEEDGLNGVDYKFSDDEKEIAANNTYNVENFIQVGSMENSQIQQATKNSSQSQEVSPDVLTALGTFVEKLKKEINQIKIEQPRLDLIKSDIDSIEKTILEGRKEKGFFIKKLQSIKAVLEGAAGNLLAEGLASRIPEILALIATS